MIGPFFEDSVLKTDFNGEFVTTCDGQNDLNPEIPFDNVEAYSEMCGSDSYGALFLMDSNDLLDVREEIIGDDKIDPSNVCPIQCPEKLKVVGSRGKLKPEKKGES
ncbi:unnamed protein product [Echinostoma caproni]|uniref:Ferredoxin n=1 Tax=Echinostoma caproni TaxID=27848 RepID=A0A183A0Y8_9TREM|nr:unnamed protein product [Echinostoma caproni]